MKKKVGSFLPKDFFQKDRPTTTIKEALKDVIPVEWEKVKKETKNKKAS